MGGDDGSLNWSFAKDIARKTSAARGPDVPDRPTSLRSQTLSGWPICGWTNRRCSPATTRSRQRSRAQWIENTFGTWQRLVSR